MHPVTVPPVTATVLHLVLDPPPPLHRVAEVTDLLRSAALSRLDWTGHDSALAGKTAAGQPMTGHWHACWLPVTDGRVLAGICLHVPAGLTPAEIAAAGSVRRVASRRVPLTRVTLLPGSRPLPAALTGPAQAWESLTPYVPDRYPKARLGGVAALVAAAALIRGLPTPAVESWPETGRWSLHRDRGRPVPPPFLLRVVFPCPVTGPVTFGHLSHFGLGVMIPARERP